MHALARVGRGALVTGSRWALPRAVKHAVAQPAQRPLGVRVGSALAGAHVWAPSACERGQRRMSSKSGPVGAAAGATAPDGLPSGQNGAGAAGAAAGAAGEAPAAVDAAGAKHRRSLEVVRSAGTMRQLHQAWYQVVLRVPYGGRRKATAPADSFLQVPVATLQAVPLGVAVAVVDKMAELAQAEAPTARFVRLLAFTLHFHLRKDDNALSLAEHARVLGNLARAPASCLSTTGITALAKHEIHRLRHARRGMSATQLVTALGALAPYTVHPKVTNAQLAFAQMARIASTMSLPTPPGADATPAEVEAFRATAGDIAAAAGSIFPAIVLPHRKRGTVGTEQSDRERGYNHRTEVAATSRNLLRQLCEWLGSDAVRPLVPDLEALELLNAARDAPVPVQKVLRPIALDVLSRVPPTLNCPTEAIPWLHLLRGVHEIHDALSMVDFVRIRRREVTQEHLLMTLEAGLAGQFEDWKPISGLHTALANQAHGLSATQLRRAVQCQAVMVDQYCHTERPRDFHYSLQRLANEAQERQAAGKLDMRTQLAIASSMANHRIKPPAGFLEHLSAGFIANEDAAFQELQTLLWILVSSDAASKEFLEVAESRALKALVGGRHASHLVPVMYCLAAAQHYPQGFFTEAFERLSVFPLAKLNAASRRQLFTTRVALACDVPGFQIPMSGERMRMLKLDARNSNRLPEGSRLRKRVLEALNGLEVDVEENVVLPLGYRVPFLLAREPVVIEAQERSEFISLTRLDVTEHGSTEWCHPFTRMRYRQIQASGFQVAHVSPYNLRQLRRAKGRQKYVGYSLASALGRLNAKREALR